MRAEGWVCGAVALAVAYAAVYEVVLSVLDARLAGYSGAAYWLFAGSASCIRLRAVHI
jgi:hypothetical protein